MSTEPSQEYQEGLWWEFLTSLEHAKARAYESPYGLRSVEDIATDPHRLAVSKEVDRSRAFLRASLKGLRENHRKLREAVDSYDEAQDS